MSTRYAGKTRFDGAFLGTEPTFARNSPSYDAGGRAVGVDEPRWWHRRKAAAGRPQFTSTGVDIGTTGEILATGVDHDNETPLMVTREPSSSNIHIRSGTGLTIQNTVTYTSLATTLSAPAGHVYTGNTWYIHNGLIICVANRNEGSGIVGQTVFYTQDNGSTWAYWQVQGVTGDASTAIGDIPQNQSAGVPATYSGGGLGNRWSVGSFPVYGVHDYQNAVITIADYIASGAFPEGGQGCIAVITRASDTGTWTLQNVRMAYETWDTALTPTVHLHAGGAVYYPESDVLSIVWAWGDGSQNNHLTAQLFTLSGYATDTPTDIDEWHGNVTSTAATSAHKFSPQPVSAVPTGDGRIAWSADTYAEVIPVCNAPRTSDDLPVWDSFDTRGKYTGGTLRDGNDPLHLRWCLTADGPRWYGGSNNDPIYHVSTDGLHFARVHLDGAEDVATLQSDGASIYYVESDGVIYSADFPAVHVQRPLRTFPGGYNEMKAAFTQFTAPATDTTRVTVYYDGRNFRYDSDDSLLDPQPRTRPPVGMTHFVEVANDDTTNDAAGFMYVTPTGQNFAGDQCQVWYVLPVASDRGARFGLAAQVRGAGTDAWFPRLDWLYSDNTNWTPVYLYGTASESNAFGITGFFCELPGRYLIAPLMHVQGKHAIAPTGPESTAEDETLSVPLALQGARWAVAGTVEWPMEATDETGDHNAFTVYGDSNNHIVVSHDATNGEIDFAITIGGSLDTTLTLTTGRLQRGDTLHWVVTSDGTDISVAASTPQNTDDDTASDTQLSTQPTAVINGDDTQSGIVPLDWYGVGWANQPANAAERGDILETLNHLSAADDGDFAVGFGSGVLAHA